MNSNFLRFLANTSDITEVTTDLSDGFLEEGINTIKEKTSEFSEILGKIQTGLLRIAPQLIFAIIILILGTLLSKLLLKIINRMMKKGNVDQTARGFIKALIRIFLNIFVYVICLSILNVPMTSIITIIGAAGLAIGLALQSSLANVAGGFILLFEKPFKAGDFIETAGASGNVETVGILYTRIVTVDNKEVYIPNGSVTNSNIVNYSKKDKRRLDLEFSISYDSDYKIAQQAILEVIDNQKNILKDEDIIVRLARHDDSWRTLVVRVWVPTSEYHNVNFDLQEKMVNAFADNGIEMPFPQLTVHKV